MAENDFEAKHIASLDLDLSKIYKQFAELNEAAQKESKEFYSSFKKGFEGQTKGKSAFEEIKKEWNGVLSDLSGKSVLKLPEMSYQSVRDATKALQEMLATQGKVSQFKYGFDEMGDAFKATATVVDKDGNKITETFKLINKNVGDAKDGTQEYEKVWQSSGGTITQKIKEVGDEFAKTDKKSQSFLSKIVDKIYWTAAFRITNTLFNIPKEIWSVMKETEMSIVEITRVLNDATIDVKEFTKEIYDLAISYGRAFDDAAEITRKFAQAGYSGDESIGLMEQALVALNTAELDVEESTTGLIAVMKQLGWSNKESVENLDLLIDKINITADRFAVNSDTLISALQKVAGTATNSGQSLDDMIGIITILSEATGASGEAIGNAYKSIISYIQRASSLATFESLGVEVYADKLKGTLLPINDILDNLANSWQGWTEATQTSFVAKNTDFIDTLNELNDSTGEYQTTLESLNDTAEIGNTIEERTAAQAAAGMHRRNYFIALMNNYNEIQDVTNNLAEAEGYSMEENARTMETLQAKMNALTTSLQALAYEWAEAGFIDGAKAIIDITTGLAKLVQTTGGLLNLLVAISGLLLIIKSQAIGATVAVLATRIATLAGNIGAFIQLAIEARSVTAALNVAFVGGQAAASGLSTAVAGVGIALLAISAVVGVMSKVKADNNAKTQESIRLAGKAVDLAKQESQQLDELIKKYKELNNAKDGTWNDTQIESVKNIQGDIVKLLGDQADGVDVINGKYDETIKKLNTISLETAVDNRQKFTDDLVLAEQELQNIVGKGEMIFFQNKKKDLSQDEREILDKYFNNIAGISGSGFSVEISSKLDASTPEETYSSYQKLLQAKKELYLSFGEDAKKLSQESLLYQDLQDKISQLTPAIQEYELALGNTNSNEINIKMRSFMAQADQSEKAVRAFMLTAKESVARGEAEADILVELIEKNYPEYFKVVKEGTDDAISNQEAYNKLLSETKVSLKNLTSAFDILKTATEEYNSTGTISLNTLSSLVELEPQYIAMLFDETGAINASKKAYDDKFKAMLTVMEAQKIDEMTTWINGLTAEQMAVEGLSSAYNSLGQSMMNSKLQGLGDALAKKVSEGILTSEEAGQLANALKSYFAMFNDIALSGGSGSSDIFKNSAQMQIDWLDFYGTNANVQLTVYENLLSKQTKLDEDRIDTLRKIAQLKIKIAEDEADATIAAKKKEWQEIDDAEEQRNHRKEMEDELAYWSLRGTSEAVKKREEIRQQMAEEDAEQQKQDERGDTLDLLEQERDTKIDQLRLQYGGLEKEVMLSMIRDASRTDNVVSINNSMGTIIGKLDDIKNKFMPSVNVTVNGANASADDIARAVRGEIERVTK